MFQLPFSKKIHNVIWIIWGIFIVIFWVYTAPERWNMLIAATPLRAYIFLYCLTCFLIAMLYRSLARKYSKKRLAVLIFFGALAIRLTALCFSVYIPENDFNTYYNLGIWFSQKDITAIAGTTADYHISKLAGVGVFYGLLSHIFSPTLLGFQIINCILTSLICLMIYIMVSVISSKAALVSAILYMIYPSSILSSQITTNHHGATLFLLLAFYAFYQLMHSNGPATGRKQLTWVLVAGTALVCSDFIHPSAILGLCAMGAFSLVQTFGNFVDCWKSKDKMTILQVFPLLRLLAVALVYVTVLHGCLGVMTSAGLTNPDYDTTLLSKIRVGLDIEHSGYWWDRGYTAIEEIKDKAMQRDFCIQEIKRNLSDGKGILNLMRDKTSYVWFGVDGYFDFYAAGANIQTAEFLQSVQDPAMHAELGQRQISMYETIGLLGQMDAMFVSAIWLFTLVGLWLLIWTSETEIIALVSWIPIGWIAFICITEGQSRYRYPSMPVLMVLAGIGISFLWDRWKNIVLEKTIQ